MIAIESVNMWQRNNDQRWSICITVRTNVSKRMNDYAITECKRVQYTSPNTLNRGMKEVLKFLHSIELQTKIGQAADPNMQTAD